MTVDERNKVGHIINTALEVGVLIGIGITGMGLITMYVIGRILA